MITFISVVRDFTLYEEFFQKNSFLSKCTFFAFNNNQDNIGISKRYNQFINSQDATENTWYVFCHEDFKLNEDLLVKLQDLSKDNIYCPIGAKLNSDGFHLHFRERITLPFRTFYGQIIQKKKNGNSPQLIGRYIQEPIDVDCADCCCLIIHSSLIQKYNLRFDENLTFDLYAEDFCINAKEQHGIITKAIQLDCEHWSGGNVTQRYYNGLKYVNDKYPDAIYSGTCSLIGGGSNTINKQLHDLLAFLKVCSFLKIDKLVNFIFLILDSVAPLIQRISKKRT